MEEFRLAIIVNAFVPVFAQTRIQRHQAVAVEMAQHPSVQYQFLMEGALFLRGARH